MLEKPPLWDDKQARPANWATLSAGGWTVRCGTCGVERLVTPTQIKAGRWLACLYCTGDGDDEQGG
jgi:hypothetical protein